MLHVGARDRRRSLGPQRERAVAAVDERVHLFVHDVGGLARRALEQGRVLEPGRGDPSPSVLRALLLHGSDHTPPQVVAWQDVVRPARRLETSAHACARSSARNGLRESSTPSVVSGPWPGWTPVSGGSRSASIRTEAISVSQSAPGRSTRPTEPAKSRSPLNSSAAAWNATCAGEWPGTAKHSKEIPATSIVSPPLTRCSGACGRPGTPTGANSGERSTRSRSPSAIQTSAPD